MIQIKFTIQIDLFQLVQTMRPILIEIPLSDLIIPRAHLLTRERIIDLASNSANYETTQVGIILTIDHDDGHAIELANIELCATPERVWWLQYVSHPEQSCGLTTAIVPDATDFAAYANTLAKQEASLGATTPSPVCAEEMEDEGLGPLAILDLRPRNRTPVVPTKADLAQLMKLMLTTASRKQ